jgi:hypothetical protein
LTLHQSWAPRGHFSSCKTPTPHHSNPFNNGEVILSGRRSNRLRHGRYLAMKQSFIVFETSLLLRFLNERARMGNFTTG